MKGVLTLRATFIAGVAALVLFIGIGLAPGRQRGPRVSPHESVNATIDGADLVVTYGRPSMRGRTIFGALVPYGRVWCPGADEATTLDSTRVLQLGTLTVPAGPHTIWMLPTADAWTLVVSKEASGFHTRYNESAELERLRPRTRLIEKPYSLVLLVETLEEMLAEANPRSG